MAIILSDVTNVLQKIIMPYIRDNFPTATILLDQLEKSEDVVFMNNYFYASMRSGRHGGVGILANDGNKLVSDRARYAQIYVGVKILTGTFDISKLTIEATKTKKGAVEAQLTGQAKSLASDFAKNTNRQYFGDGSGVISQSNGSSSSSKMAVESPDSDGEALDSRAHDKHGTINYDISPTEYLTVGKVITCGSGSGSAGTLGTVTNVGSAGTISYAADVSGTSNQMIYTCDADGEGSGTAEINGLGDALASDRGGTSTYAGTTRATYAMAAQHGSTAEALSLSRMEEKYLAAYKYAQKGDRYAIFVNKTLFKKYGDILSSMRRSIKKTENLLGGWPGLEFQVGAGKVGVFLDFDTPDGECLIVNLDTFTKCQVTDLDWMEDPTGGGLLRKVDYITYQATMVWFTNLLCLCPAASAKLCRKTD